MPGPADDDASPLRSHVTLALTTVLHAFTHAYGTMLVPLYLLIVDDLRLPGVKSASLVVTVYGFVYCAISFAVGALADRTNRKLLLGLGLIVNALAIFLMGLTHQYVPLLLLGVLGGAAGAIFHPAANALVPAHYPKNPGMAIGLLGIGAGIGFFAGPQFAGWRAEAGGWQWQGLADWQRPCVELGLVGMIFGVIFLIAARETPRDVEAAAGGAPTAEPSRRPRVRARLEPDMLAKVRWVALVLSCRDLAGVASLSLASIYFQKALGFDVKRAGFILGATMLIAVVVNPVSVWLSPGRRRLPMLAGILILGAVMITITPFVGPALVLPVLCAFQACHLGSYAVSEAGMLERVPPAVRGRVVGQFLTIAGTIASTGPWLMGYWTDRMGAAASDPAAYAKPFGLLGVLLLIASFSTLLIARLGRPPVGQQIDPLSEISPQTVEAVG